MNFKKKGMSGKEGNAGTERHMERKPEGWWVGGGDLEVGGDSVRLHRVQTSDSIQNETEKKEFLQDVDLSLSEKHPKFRKKSHDAFKVLENHHVKKTTSFDKNQKKKQKTGRLRSVTASVQPGRLITCSVSSSFY